MGAVFITDCLPADCDVPAWFRERKAQAEYDHGHAGYSGSWAEVRGVKHVSMKPFDGMSEAEDWLIDNAQKWEEALVVALKDGRWMIGAWASS